MNREKGKRERGRQKEGRKRERERSEKKRERGEGVKRERGEGVKRRGERRSHTRGSAAGMRSDEGERRGGRGDCAVTLLRFCTHRAPSPSPFLIPVSLSPPPAPPTLGGSKCHFTAHLLRTGSFSAASRRRR